MSWMGKIIGGGIGMALGGPLGAVIGASLGHTFVDAQAGVGTGPRLSPGETKQAVFFATTFAMLGKMAKADGRVSEEEVRVVEGFIRDRLGLDPRAREFAIKIFNEGKTSRAPFSAYAKQFGDVFAGEHEMRVMLFELLFALALADGSLHTAEDRLLKESLGPLRLESRVYDELRRRAAPDLAHLYAVLGCRENATDEELKKAYRKACREFHPDTIVSKGLPEEFTKFAESKFKEINHAYETLVKQRAARG
jgi:DnaJ like chaperone protein